MGGPQADRPAVGRGGEVTLVGRMGEAEDFEAFAAFVAARQHALLRSAYLLTGDRHLAEDLLQGAMTKLALHWNRVRYGNPEGFVRTILYRDFVSWWRRDRRERLGPAPEVIGADAAHAVDLRLTLQRALDQLSSRQRAVVVLRFYDDLTEQQAAHVLGVSVGTVKSQTHVALRRLRQVAPELREVLTEDVR